MTFWCSVPVKKDASDDMTLNTTLNTTDPASGILNCNIYPHATNCIVEIVKLILTYFTTVNFNIHDRFVNAFIDYKSSINKKCQQGWQWDERRDAIQYPFIFSVHQLPFS